MFQICTALSLTARAAFCSTRVFCVLCESSIGLGQKGTDSPRLSSPTNSRAAWRLDHHRAFRGSVCFACQGQFLPGLPCDHWKLHCLVDTKE